MMESGLVSENLLKDRLVSQAFFDALFAGPKILHATLQAAGYISGQGV